MTSSRRPSRWWVSPSIRYGSAGTSICLRVRDGTSIVGRDALLDVPGDDIDALSQKYNGQPYPAGAITSERVIVKIAPERQRIFGG